MGAMNLINMSSEHAHNSIRNWGIDSSFIRLEEVDLV